MLDFVTEVITRRSFGVVDIDVVTLLAVAVLVSSDVASPTVVIGAMVNVVVGAISV